MKWGAKPMATLTAEEKWGLPRKEDYDSFLKEDDQVRIVVRGWQWVEASLALAIADRLPVGADLVELDRMPARMRIDLCAGMGAFPLDTHGSFIRMNTVRNHFVHRQKTRLTGKDRKDLFSTWTSAMKAAGHPLDTNGRSGATAILRSTLVIQTLLLRSGIEHYRDAAIKQELTLERLSAMANQIREGLRISDLPRDDHERELARRKSERYSSLGEI
jgi:hypothetical protein